MDWIMKRVSDGRPERGMFYQCAERLRRRIGLDMDDDAHHVETERFWSEVAGPPNGRSVNIGLQFQLEPTDWNPLSDRVRVNA